MKWLYWSLAMSIATKKIAASCVDKHLLISSYVGLLLMHHTFFPCMSDCTISSRIFQLLKPHESPDGEFTQYAAICCELTSSILLNGIS
jgi:hypothetical protein